MASHARCGFTLWFTGWSGAGKTSIAQAVTNVLRTAGHCVELLDGDEVRVQPLCQY
jgi:adenylylsulfate kinase